MYVYVGDFISVCLCLVSRVFVNVSVGVLRVRDVSVSLCMLIMYACSLYMHAYVCSAV